MSATIYKCHKIGHYQSDCPKWGKEAYYVEFDAEEEKLLMKSRSTRGDNWFLDSGCSTSNHMCGDNSWFSEIDDTFKEHVKFGNNTKIEVTRKGSVKLNLNELLIS